MFYPLNSVLAIGLLSALRITGASPLYEKHGDCIFPTIPCDPNAVNRHIESLLFGEIRPCIVYARFEVSGTFLCVFFFLNNLRVVVR